MALSGNESPALPIDEVFHISAAPEVVSAKKRVNPPKSFRGVNFSKAPAPGHI